MRFKERTLSHAVRRARSGVSVPALNIERAITAKAELRSTSVATTLADAIGEFCARTAEYDLPH